MKKIQYFKGFLVAAGLCLFIGGQALAAGVMQNVIAATDAQLAQCFRTFAANVPAVPAPGLPSAGQAADQNGSVYFPLVPKAVYTYVYTSSAFYGPKTIRLEYLHYSAKDRAVSVMKTITYNGASRNEVYGVHAQDDGVYATGGLIGGRRMEFPLPVTVNKDWSETAGVTRIASVEAVRQVPAGTFRGCLQVTAGGDDAGAERYYAPGVGLVYEQLRAAGRTDTVKLVSFELN